MRTAVTATILPLLLLFAWIMGAVVIAVLLLRRRDRIARQEGKTAEQVQAECAAVLQLRTTLNRAVPGVLLMMFGVYFTVDRYQQHDSEWWISLFFIAVGWFLVPLLARNSWRRYRKLRRFADMTPEDFVRTEPPLDES